MHLYGYGGFEVSEYAYYRSPVGKLWLERGGTSVVANIRRVDAFERESNGEAFLFAQDPVTPMQMKLVDVTRESAPVVLKRMPELFDARGLVVTRHEAVAEDGERIPYVQVGPASQ